MTLKICSFNPITKIFIQFNHNRFLINPLIIFFQSVYGFISGMDHKKYMSMPSTATKKKTSQQLWEQIPNVQYEIQKRNHGNWIGIRYLWKKVPSDWFGNIILIIIIKKNKNKKINKLIKYSVKTITRQVTGDCCMTRGVDSAEKNFHPIWGNEWM